MSTYELIEPPRKKQKISSTKSIAINPSTTKQPKTNSEHDQKSTEEPYYYTLHINPDIILCSTDPETPINHDFEIEPYASKPNLFIVQKTMASYDEREWLHYHSQQRNDIKRAAKLVSNPNLSLLIVTGAGMGCDSNLPDYRSKGGFWNDYKPLKDSDLSLYDMSKTDWFHSDPSSAWGFYAHRAQLYRNAVPHLGFQRLYEWSVKRGRDYFYMTSNIDGQVSKAGFAKEKVIQTHGSLYHLQCLDCCGQCGIVPFCEGYKALEIDDRFRVKDLECVPKCEGCHGLLRPNVSFFSDTNESFNAERSVKQKQRFMAWLKVFMAGSESARARAKKELLLIEIGCGTSVHSLRWECEHLKGLENVTLLRINPSETLQRIEGCGDSDRHIVLKLTAKTALNAINDELECIINSTEILKKKSD